MGIQLIGSIRSPFVRLCRIFMLQNKITHEFQALNFIELAEDTKKLEGLTAINKVPLLIYEGHKIYDSRVILNFLIKTYRLDPLSWDEENLLSLIYGAIDAGVLLFLLRKDGFDINSNYTLIARNRERIPKILSELTDFANSQEAHNPNHWRIPTIAFYSFLYWADKRELVELEDFPDLSDFKNRFSNAPFVSDTGF